MQKQKYLDEIDENKIKKNLIYSCENSLQDVELEDDEETQNLIKHEQMFNRL